MADQDPNQYALAQGKTFSWHELYSADADKAKEFYTAVFGWETTSMASSMGGDYTMFVNHGVPVAGYMGTAGNDMLKDVPPHWSVYITVDNVDASVAKCTSLGATVMVPAMDIPNVGRICLLKDPQGAVFWVFQHAPMG